MKLLRMLPPSLTGLALLSAALAIPSNAQTGPTRRPRIAVLDFDDGTMQTPSAAMSGTNFGAISSRPSPEKPPRRRWTNLPPTS